MPIFFKTKILIEQLITLKSGKLANKLADFLFIIEKSELNNKDEDYIHKISCLIDSYATRYDKVINSYKASMQKEVLDIFSDLSFEINELKGNKNCHNFHFPPQKKEVLANTAENKNNQNLIKDFRDEVVSETIAATIRLIRDTKGDLIQSLFENFDFSIVLKDLNNNILNLNGPAAASMGGTINELKHANIHDIIPKFSKLSHEKDLEVIKNNMPIRNIIQEFIFSNGRVSTIKVDKIPIITTKQEPLILSVFREMPSVANNNNRPTVKMSKD